MKKWLRSWLGIQDLPVIRGDMVGLSDEQFAEIIAAVRVEIPGCPVDLESRVSQLESSISANADTHRAEQRNMEFQVRQLIIRFDVMESSIGALTPAQQKAVVRIFEEIKLLGEAILRRNP